MNSIRNKKFILFCFLGFSVLLYLSQMEHISFPSWNFCKCQNQEESFAEFRTKILKGLKHVATAHRHARSSKTLIELQQAYSSINSALYEIHRKMENSHLLLSDIERINPEPVNEMLTRRKQDNQTESKSIEVEVCPEVYEGSRHGYPYYETGYTMQCSSNTHPKPLSNLLTLVFNLINEITVGNFVNILEDLKTAKSSHNNYSRLPMIIAAQESNFDDVKAKLLELDANYQVLFFNEETTTGQILIKMLKKVATKYVFVARDLIRIDSFSRFERLIRILGELNADYVSGSHRNASGHWENGCYQMGIKMYTMKIVEGYDLSYNSCIYCDYVSGPFFAKTAFLLKNLDYTLTGESFYADLWLKSYSSGIILTCPDSMFHTNSIGVDSHNKQDWLSLAKRHRLNRFVLPETTFTFTCSELGVGCSVTPGILNPLCCFSELDNALKLIAKEFNSHGIQYDLDTGSNVGAVKMSGTLPWEYDHDLNVRYSNFSAALKLDEVLTRHGCKIVNEPSYASNCKNTSINCGKMNVYTKHWFIELWGVNWLIENITNFMLILPFLRFKFSLLRFRPHSLGRKTRMNKLIARMNTYSCTGVETK